MDSAPPDSSASAAHRRDRSQVALTSAVLAVCVSALFGALCSLHAHAEHWWMLACLAGGAGVVGLLLGIAACHKAAGILFSCLGAGIAFGACTFMYALCEVQAPGATLVASTVGGAISTAALGLRGYIRARSWTGKAIWGFGLALVTPGFVSLFCAASSVMGEVGPLLGAGLITLCSLYALLGSLQRAA